MNSESQVWLVFTQELKNHRSRAFSLVCTIFRINPLEYREGLEQIVTVIQRSNQARAHRLMQGWLFVTTTWNLEK